MHRVFGHYLFAVSAGTLFAAAAILSTVLVRTGLAEEIEYTLCACLQNTIFDERCDKQDKDDDKEPKINYGPCRCQARKTLMQWSYGTTFSGGPPAMDEPLESDRPDFTQASTTVGRGVAQLEMGYTYTLDRAGGTTATQQSFPEMLWRVGLFAEWFEFRVEYNYAINEVDNRTLPARQANCGSQDLYLGAKLGLTPQEGILPEMAILPQMTVPSGSPSQTAGEVLPGVNWLYSWEINDFLQLGCSSQVNRAIDDVGTFYTQFAQSASMGYDLTEKLHGYTEWYCLIPDGRTTEQVQQYADGGFTYHVTNNFQLDIRAGVGLNAAANNFFTGAGTVMRF